MKHHVSLAVAVLAALLLACVHIVPQELVDARLAYDRAAYGPAGTYTQVELTIAEDALDLAQEMFQANGDTALVRAQANIATRVAELVDALARVAQRIAEEQRLRLGAGS